MKNKWFFILFLFMMTLFSGCSPKISKPSSEIETPTSEKKVYQKDEEGFYILEKDYFNFSQEEIKGKVNKITFDESLPKEDSYAPMRLFIGDKQIPIFACKVNISQTWNAEAPSRVNSGVASFSLEGKVELKLQCNFLLHDECEISPKSLQVPFSLDEQRRVITFTISQPGQYTIECRDGRTLHLFVDSYKAYDKYLSQPNLIYFGPGIHDASNSSYINSQNTINLASNTTVFIDQGAIVKAGFYAYQKENINIVGYGIVDGSSFKRSATTNEKLIPYEFNYCSHISFKGIITTDPAGWCYNLYFCQDVTLDNIKLISSRSNGDGISVQSCQNVLVTHSFVRSWDDSLVVKNYPSWNSSSSGTTKNIEFNHCILWTDLAQSMEIGFETLGQVMEDIRFIDITVIHNYHKAILSIHNANDAHIKNVLYQNITIEDAAMGKGDGRPTLLEFTCQFSSTWSTNHGVTALGSIDGVKVENVLIEKSITHPNINLLGSIDTRTGYGNSVHMISNVIIEDMLLENQIVDQNYSNLYQAYTSQIQFKKNRSYINGASIEKLDVSSYGNQVVIG